MSGDRVTGVFEEVAGETTTTGDLGATLPPAAPPEGEAARLVVLEGTQSGRHWRLGARASIGRSTANDVTLEDELVSREHAVISRDEAGWLVRDLGSRNGTFVNGRRADVERLAYGDRIAIGRSVLLLAHVDPVHERLLERQKIEALGRLGAGIAHDLNNYFGAILGALEYLESLPMDRTLRDREVRECHDDVRSATRRGAELTQRLLAFARRGGEEHEAIDVPRLCHEAAELARRTFDRSLRIEVAATAGLTVRGDRGRLHQVLMNLLVNARDAMPRGGTIRVRAIAAPPARGGSASPGRIRIEVEDQGEGMDEETRARAFEPFFTTKPAERGTGLGLAIALDVVSGHGGTIECESALGRGTIFRIELPEGGPRGPARPDRLTPHEAPLREPDPRPGTVLVVDDEPMVRRTMKRLLERSGHAVIEATDGKRALERIAAEPDAMQVVLMDLDMPELDGESASRELRSRRPDLPIVVLSGLCDDARRRRLEALGVHAILQKPCDAATLRRAIRSAIDRGPPRGRRPT